MSGGIQSITNRKSASCLALLNLWRMVERVEHSFRVHLLQKGYLEVRSLPYSRMESISSSLAFSMFSSARSDFAEDFAEFERGATSVTHIDEEIEDPQ
jgi:hypothetical protein